MEEQWPEFVTEGEGASRPNAATAHLTGWETVVFELSDDQDAGGSVFSTAAIAP
jgi:hypothetical protein